MGGACPGPHSRLLVPSPRQACEAGTGCCCLSCAVGGRCLCPPSVGLWLPPSHLLPSLIPLRATVVLLSHRTRRNEIASLGLPFPAEPRRPGAWSRRRSAPPGAMDPCCVCLCLWGLLTGGALWGGWAEPIWNMHVPPWITGLRGDSIVLPCTFTHPHHDYMGKIQVIWKPNIFQCLVNNRSTETGSFENCTTGQEPSGRYRLAGDPRRHNLSLHIAGLRFEDSRVYKCRVVLLGIRGGAYEHSAGITLTVEAQPSILNLTLFPGPLPVWLACTAEGIPVPNITWLGPAVSEVVQLQDSTGSWNQMTQVVSVSRNGTYTCRAENVHGRVESSVLVGLKGPKGPLLLLTILPAALFLLAVLLLALCGRWKGGRESVGRAQPGEADTCSPCQPAAHANGLPPAQALPQPGPSSPVRQLPVSPAENPDSCTYADLIFPSAGAGRRGHQPAAQSPPAPVEEVTYSELMPYRGPR
ncbi:sialic acid-binding Ig-like lectin 15 isoform X2 [Dermochelys coriacea]|uniref:sialic acid-binding Ig-like lectin 15 isoform X2 n=1 Tax=Dermochelys coriacea TaxID=27794 RepID=UPI001CA8E673|nr:sialic acid-binding Ig-like lectin 15 isoform X2 [Dermochelys coriacea]